MENRSDSRKQKISTNRWTNSGMENRSDNRKQIISTNRWKNSGMHECMNRMRIGRTTCSEHTHLIITFWYCWRCSAGQYGSIICLAHSTSCSASAVSCALAGGELVDVHCSSRAEAAMLCTNRRPHLSTHALELGDIRPVSNWVSSLNWSVIDAQFIMWIPAIMNRCSNVFLSQNRQNQPGFREANNCMLSFAQSGSEWAAGQSVCTWQYGLLW